MYGRVYHIPTQKATVFIKTVKRMILKELGGGREDTSTCYFDTSMLRHFDKLSAPLSSAQALSAPQSSVQVSAARGDTSARRGATLRQAVM